MNTLRVAATACFVVICAGCSDPASPAASPQSHAPSGSTTALGSNAPDDGESQEEATKIAAAINRSQSGDVEGALGVLKELTDANPRLARAFAVAGRLQADRGQKEEAIASLSKAIWERPNYYEAHLERANCLMALERLDEALKDLDLVVEKLSAGEMSDLDDQGRKYLASAYASRAIIFDLQDENARAIEEYASAIEILPRQPEFWAYRGKLFLRTRNGAEARADIDHALELAPNDVSALDAKVALEDDEEFGNRERFAEFIGQLMSVAEEGTEPYYTGMLRRGVWLVETKHYREGLADLERYLEFNRNSATMNRVAWVLATCPDSQIRNGEKAKTIAQEAFTLSENKDMFCLGTLAAAYAELGDFDRAITLQEQALADADYATTESDVAKARLQGYRDHKPHRDN